MTDPPGERTPRRRPRADPARGGAGVAGDARAMSRTSSRTARGSGGAGSAGDPPGRPPKSARTGARNTDAGTKAGTSERASKGAGRPARASSVSAARKPAADADSAGKPGRDRPEPARGPGGRWPVADRSLLPTVLGVPPIAAVGFAAALTAIGVFVDLTWVGNLSTVFTVCHISGCVLAVAWVRRSGLFGPMVQPPLLVAAAVPVVVLLAGSPRPGQGVSEQLLVIGAPLVNAFPVMAWATGSVLALGLLRVLLQRGV
jgi:hypothetical protein